jgi:hypothetical protein
MTAEQAEALLEGKHHPYEGQHEHQVNILMNLKPDMVDTISYTFRIGNVHYLYYHEHKHITPDADDMEEWLSSLHPPIQYNQDERKATQSLDAKRHALERRDIGLNEYMKTNLSRNDYLIWWNLGEESRQRRNVNADPL